MFDPINGPTNQYEGPATGLTTEKGDSWHTAVKKINDGFKAVVAVLEAPFSAEGMEIVDAEARKEVSDLRETVAAQQIALDAAKQATAHIESVASDYAFKVDALEKRIEDLKVTIDRMAMAAVTAAPTPPVQTPPAEAAATEGAATNV